MSHILTISVGVTVRLNRGDTWADGQDRTRQDTDRSQDSSYVDSFTSADVHDVTDLPRLPASPLNASISIDLSILFLRNFPHHFMPARTHARSNFTRFN